MLLYHYCSNFSFQSIVQHRRLRLSPLTMSNDAKEGRHVLDAARRILPDSFRSKDTALEELERIISYVSALGFCLSEDGDVLSQWRGYADNAQGVAIGFASETLQSSIKKESRDKFVAELVPVLYDTAESFELLTQDLRPIIQHYDSGKMRFPSAGTILTPLTDDEKKSEQDRFSLAVSDLAYMLIKIANYAYLIKSPFFREEREWRIISLIANAKHELALPDAEFHATSDRIRPYRNFPLDGFEPTTIKEIVLGPRNQTPIAVVKLLLQTAGFEYVDVRSSVGSYR
jgi:hypothetical protein